MRHYKLGLRQFYSWFLYDFSKNQLFGQLLRNCLISGQNLRLTAKQLSCLQKKCVSEKVPSTESYTLSVTRNPFYETNSTLKSQIFQKFSYKFCRAPPRSTINFLTFWFQERGTRRHIMEVFGSGMKIWITWSLSKRLEYLHAEIFISCKLFSGATDFIHNSWKLDWENCWVWSPIRINYYFDNTIVVFRWFGSSMRPSLLFSWNKMYMTCSKNLRWELITSMTVRYPHGLF